MKSDELISFWRNQLDSLVNPEVEPLSRPTNILNTPISKIASFIDHTNLRVDASQEDIEACCSLALEHNFAAVCVYPVWVSSVRARLDKSNIKTCTVAGFPHGNTPTANKVHEAKRAADDGAQEIDMVLQIGALKSRQYPFVLSDIKAVVSAAPHCVIKVIIETALLSLEEKIVASLLVQGSGAHFIKTSTGFAAHGATVEDVSLISKVANGTVGVKASGGLKTPEDAQNLLKAGATRLGTSRSVDIVQGLS